MTDQPSLFGETIVAKTTRRCLFNDREIEAKFNELWDNRPRRHGSNPKEAARKKFTAMVKDGENPDEMIAGVRQLRDHYASENPDGLFVPMVTTILNQKRWVGDLHRGGADRGGSFLDIAEGLQARYDERSDYSGTPDYRGPVARLR